MTGDTPGTRGACCELPEGHTGKHEAMMSDQQPGAPAVPGAITEAELAEALAQLAARTGNGNSYFPELARNIFGYVETRRETEYEPGGIYESPAGQRYLRRPGRPLLPSARIFPDGAVSEYPEDAPVRPLRRLVPAPSRDAIYAAIRAGLASGIEREDCGQLTSRICELLEEVRPGGC